MTELRSIPLLTAVVIGLVVVGFLTGLRGSGEALPSHATQPVGVSGAPAAVAYAALPTATIRPNASRQQSLPQLQYERPGLFDTVTNTPALKQYAVEDRAWNRAFDGAPPTIPHPVSVSTATGCLTCHGEGLKVGDRTASKMSHPLMTNCTQCHAEQSPSAFPPSQPSTSTFAGLARYGPGDRASPGAPPTIPHPLWLRENCLTCHGLITRPGLRTSHPFLSNCTQCHAARADLDTFYFQENRP